MLYTPCLHFTMLCIMNTVGMLWSALSVLNVFLLEFHHPLWMLLVNLLCSGASSIKMPSSQWSSDSCPCKTAWEIFADFSTLLAYVWHAWAYALVLHAWSFKNKHCNDTLNECCRHTYYFCYLLCRITTSVTKHCCQPCQVLFSNTVCVLCTSELVPALYQCETVLPSYVVNFCMDVGLSKFA